ncbi:MAG: integrase arm-type DNA-binding domain-containing protein [Pseudomonadota bacterium]|nr:integrase arm-type DNA-binding domain-containing protein [Pseudomonadota bacterium]
MGSLTAAAVRSATARGRYGDGDGLFLLVTEAGSRSWVCRVQKNGRRRDYGLGSAKKVTLAKARELAREIRSQVHAGLDPILERRRREGIPTFREAAAKVFAENHKSWRNAKHRAQWLSSLEAYVFPIFGDVAVSEIDGPLVRDALVAIWLEKPETARRVRQRIVSVVDWAIGRGYRSSPLPMAAINKSLPRGKRRKAHLAALPYTQVPEFIRVLRQRESVGRLAFEALILTAARSGEIRNAVWSEFDLDACLWTIPASRMKAEREHVVPLSDAAVDVLRRASAYREARSDLVFPGMKAGKPMSDMTLNKICRDMGADAVPHGFRSSFRDWVSEETEFDGDIAEMALAHTIQNKVEAAYRRGNLLEKRRRLMEAWSRYCLPTSQVATK